MKLLNLFNISFRLRISAIWMVVLLFLAGCDIKKNNKETDPKRDFIRIYENNDFSQSFIPIGIQQTSDEGYIILARKRIPESSFFGIYVMKADPQGEFISAQSLSADFVNPISNLLKVNGGYYFFAMNRLTLEARLMSIDESGNVSEVATVSNIIYPLYASLDENSGQFILQHYNLDDRKTVISRINTGGVVTATREFDIGFGDFDAEEPIIDHLTGNGKQLPFLTGSAGGGTYFFNGFYNYNLSTVFFTFGSGTTGVLQGYKDERCISSALYLDGNRFAISRYAYGDTYLTPNASLNTGGISSNSNISGNLMVEFSADAKVTVKRLNIGGRNVLVYNSDTKGKQICLYFYDVANGALLGAKHLGFSNPYEVGNFTSTSDGGLAIVGTTFLAGRFPRIVLFKISKEDLEAF